MWSDQLCDQTRFSSRLEQIERHRKADRIIRDGRSTDRHQEPQLRAYILRSITSTTSSGPAEEALLLVCSGLLCLSLCFEGFESGLWRGF